ncbi:MAG: hypothetical protein QOK05_2339, partial [Chloroflexota bacterium]|nr:hypothetical protein [Chloroflexota bacterium]
MEQLVVRMASDPAFAEEVRADPTSALASYELSEAERDSLAGLGGDQAGSTATLGTRQSKSSLLFGLHTGGAEHAATHAADLSHTHGGAGAVTHTDHVATPAVHHAAPHPHVPAPHHPGTVAIGTAPHVTNPPAGTPGPDGTVADGNGGFTSPIHVNPAAGTVNPDGSVSDG